MNETPRSSQVFWNWNKCSIDLENMILSEKSRVEQFIIKL